MKPQKTPFGKSSSPLKDISNFGVRRDEEYYESFAPKDTHFLCSEISHELRQIDGLVDASRSLITLEKLTNHELGRFAAAVAVIKASLQEWHNFFKSVAERTDAPQNQEIEVQLDSPMAVSVSCLSSSPSKISQSPLVNCHVPLISQSPLIPFSSTRKVMRYASEDKHTSGLLSPQHFNYSWTPSPKFPAVTCSHTTPFKKPTPDSEGSCLGTPVALQPYLQCSESYNPFELTPMPPSDILQKYSNLLSDGHILNFGPCFPVPVTPRFGASPLRK